MKCGLRSVVCAALMLFIAAPAPAGEKTVGVWMSPGGPPGVWEKSYGDPFPAKMIVKDLAEMGVSDIFFFEQAGRGGPFLHPTQVQYAKTDARMKGRDFLEDLLEETGKCDMKVWLAWTPPDGKYPGTEFRGLNDPNILKLYTDEIEEVAQNYGRCKNLAGIMWHEVDCSEQPDQHEDDVAAFSEFCLRSFGEKFGSDKIPPAAPDDKWWRRYVLYKADIVNSLVAKTGKAAARHGLKMHFCFYAPECYVGESWGWGYDVIDLEKLCDRQWFSGYGVESGKPYQTINGAFMDFGPSYRGQILPRNYSYAFHGRPISYFEHRGPVYLKEMRRHYSSIKSFVEKYGDFYTGYAGHTEKELSLFYGKENLKNWLDLMAWWQGGESPAKVAVAVNPTPFVMRYPGSPGAEYDKKVRGMMEGVTSCLDVDGLVLGSRYSLDPRNLLRYSLLIIPEDMGAGLSQETAKVLREYLKGGGKLLVVSTPLKTGKRDLTEEADLTAEFCGVEVVKPRLPGYLKPSSEKIALDDKKFWAAGLKEIVIKDAEVLVKEGIAGYPLLLMKGNTYFSAMGYSPESAAYFAAVVRYLASPPAQLSESMGIRILESVRKEGMVCLALWGKGKAALKLDPKALGLGGGACRVKDVVTGRVIGDFAADGLIAGVPIEIKYVSQPFVLAVGSQEAVEVFKGIYPSEDVFAGMTEGVTIESPEVPSIQSNGSPGKQNRSGR